LERAGLVFVLNIKGACQLLLKEQDTSAFSHLSPEREVLQLTLYEISAGSKNEF